jgi:hypothetical protein
MYVWDLFPTELVTKVKPDINSVEIHSQLSNKGHPVDDESRIPFHTQRFWMPIKIFGDCKISF